MARGFSIRTVVAAAIALTLVAALAVWWVGSDRATPTTGREVVVGFYDNPPKLYLGPDGERLGLFPEILEEIAAAEGWTINWVDCEWSECLTLLEVGVLQLMPDVAYSPGRDQVFDFHETSVASSWSQVYVAPGRSVTELADLDGLRIAMLDGGIQQDFVADLMESAGYEFEPLLVDDLHDGYAAVVRGDADAVVTNSFFAARNNERYQLQETPIVFLPSTLYVAAPDGRHADLLEAIDRHLVEWRRDAESPYYTALYRAMAAPPDEVSSALPRWVPWSILGLVVGVALVGAIALLLRHEVAQRTRELDEERAGLERLVAERTRELEEAKDEAERLSHVKSDFLASMSHEIRTPMNAILGMLYLALRDDPPPTMHRHLTRAQAAAQSLLGIIDDILDISKIEAGRLTLESTEFGLDGVIEHVTSAVGLAAEEKGVELLVRYDPELPTTLIGDPLRLGQVLLNLCSNAVKFTDQGHVEVGLSALEMDDDELVLRVHVRDSGIGISPEQQERLFQSFSQADQSTTRRYGGTGLGLSISKSLVEMMGGRIWLDQSVPGVGSTFCFTARLGVAADARQRQLSLAQEAGPLLEGVPVLVVDDNEVSREIMADTYRHFRLEVATAPDGPSALETLRRASRQRPVELVLLDWRMPEMTGDEVTLRIFGDPDIQPKPKVVMATAYGDERVFRRAEEVGVDALLAKPVTPSTLLDTTLSVLGRERIFGRHAAEPRPRAAAGGLLAGMRILLAEDNPINREFARELLTGEGAEIVEAVNGRDAVERTVQEQPDVVLMDIQMPEMDGLEAARTLRDRGITVPIVAMTALAMSHDAARSREAGMDAHVTKPIDPPHLFEVLTELVGTRRGEPAPAVEAVAAPRGEIPADLLALGSLEVPAAVQRIGGNPEAYRRQLLRFRDHHAHEIDELAELVRAGDLEAAHERCHLLKGITGNLGATRLCAKISEIDRVLKDSLAPDPHLLDEARALLDLVLADIAGLDPGAPPAEPPPPLGEGELVDLVARLRDALETDLGVVEPLLRRLREGSAGTALEAQVEQVAALVDLFEIDDALALLDTLVEPAPSASRGEA